MNRKIKLSLITLLSIVSISIASLPLVSCGNSETTPTTSPEKDHNFKTEDGINIRPNIDGTAWITKSDDTYRGGNSLTLEESYVSPIDSKSYRIIGIEDRAFYSSRFTSLDLSQNISLTSIGNSAFTDSLITSLDLSQNTSLTSIGYYAFFNSKLKTLDLSKNTSLTSIGGMAFYTNPLMHLLLPTSLTFIGDWSFAHSVLTSLDLSKNTSLESIGDNSFMSSKLSSLKIPNSVTAIGNGAFYSTKSIDAANLIVPIEFNTTEELTRIGITIKP